MAPFSERSIDQGRFLCLGIIYIICWAKIKRLFRRKGLRYKETNFYVAGLLAPPREDVLAFGSYF